MSDVGDAIVVTGLRSLTAFSFDISDLVGQAGTVENLDQIVVTARRRLILAGVQINFNLNYPLEQMWVNSDSRGIVHVPTVAVTRRDCRGREFAANSPDPAFVMPNDVSDIIHSHTNFMFAYPFAGDYRLAQTYNVYGITPSAVWVLRRGAAFRSAPEVLWGSSPGVMPAAGGC